MNHATKSFALAIALASGATGAQAAGAPVTYQFAPGDTISSTEMNSNFQELADRIDTNASADVIDLSTYGFPVGIANFDRERMYSDGTTPTAFLNVVLETGAKDASGFFNQTFELYRSDLTLSYRSITELQSTPLGLRLIQETEQSYASDGVTLGYQHTDVPDSDYYLLPPAMKLGQTYVDGSSFTRTVALPTPEVKTVVEFRKFTVSHKVAQFDGYQDCIKVSRVISGNRNPRDEARVLCANQGMVANIREFRFFSGQLVAELWSRVTPP